MHNSKLYSILKDFDKYEQNRLRKYVNSPYFNKSEALTKLLEFLLVDISVQSKEGNSFTSKEEIWQKLGFQKAFDDVRFRKLHSDLLKLIEGFLAQQTYDSNPLHQATYLIEAVSKRKLDKMYNGTLRTARRLSDQQYFKPANYFYYQYQIEKNYFDIFQDLETRESRNNVEKIANNLDAFYIAEKLKYYCHVLNQQYYVSHEYKMLFIQEIIDHIQKYNYEDVAQIALYYQMYLTLTDSNDENQYFNLKDKLKKFIHELPIQDAQDICSVALNVCIIHINKGKQKFIHEYFDLLEFLLNKDLIYSNEIRYSAFKNTIVIANRLGKYKWAEKFINNYKDKLPESSRENAVTYNLAQVYFYQKKYDDVIGLLRTVEYEDVFYNLDSKSLLLATYYEMDQIDPLYSLFDSFRASINRNKKIPEDRRIAYLNLIKFTKKLTKLIQGDSRGLAKLKEEFDNVDGPISSKNWLTQKIAEKEGKKST